MLKLRVCIIALLSILLMACNRDVGDIDTKNIISNNLISGKKDGEYHIGYFFQEDCVTDIDANIFRVTTYDDIKLENICSNPVCTHDDDSVCTAYKLEHGDNSIKSFCLTYNNKLMIFDGYYEDEEKENQSIENWKTDIYEAELDGSNRKCVLSIDACIMRASGILNSMVLVDGKLYFGGTKFISYDYSQDKNGLPIWSNSTAHAIYCIDLNNYSVEEYFEEDNDLTFCLVYEYDDWVYIAKRQDPNYVLYRINNETNQSEKVLESKEIIILSGVIGDTLYYQYQHRDVDKLYKKDIGPEKEVIILENVHNAKIIDKKIFVMEKGYTDNHTKYSMYDADVNLIDVFDYKDFIYFCGDVGDKIIYYTRSIVGIVDKKDIKELMTRGKELGAL